MALQDWFEENEGWRHIRGFSFASYGFLDPETEGNALGIIVYANWRTEIDIQTKIEVGGLTFPIVLRSGWRLLPAASNVQPLNGTSTGWAHSTHEKGKWCVLTAAHVLSKGHGPWQFAIGDRVPMSNGSQASVWNVAPYPIDATLLELDDEPGTEEIQALETIPVENLVAQYMDVLVEGGFSGPQPVKVMDMTDTRGVFRSSYFPIRIFLTHPLQPGDSGSPVTAAGKGIGIYTAALGDIEGRTEEVGVCQHLGQATYCLNVDEIKHI